MIVREFYKTREDGVRLWRTYSDDDRYIQKVGTTEIYAEAVDVEDSKFEYVETEERINQAEEEMQILNQ